MWKKLAFSFVFLLPVLAYGQRSQYIASPGESFRWVFEGGREGVLMERFSSNIKPFNIRLDMVGKTCGPSMGPSYIMSVPLEKREITYVWAENRRDPELVSRKFGLAYLLTISPFHRLLWRQSGFDPPGRSEEKITLQPLDYPAEEKVGIRSMAFQANVNNDQQYILTAGGIHSILDEDGRYRLVEIETIGLGHIDSDLLKELAEVDLVEFIVEADFSLCRAVFSATVLKQENQVFTDMVNLFGPIPVHEMTPVIVDDGDPHQLLDRHLRLNIFYRW